MISGDRAILYGPVIEPTVGGPPCDLVLYLHMTEQIEGGIRIYYRTAVGGVLTPLFERSEKTTSTLVR